MNKILMFGVLLLLPMVAIAQVNSTNSVVEVSVSNKMTKLLYSQFLEEYNADNYDEARVIAKILIKKYPDSREAQKARDILSTIKSDKQIKTITSDEKIPPKRQSLRLSIIDYDGTIAYWVGNIAYLGVAFVNIPFIFSPTNSFDTVSIFAGLGVASGVATSYFTLKNSKMTLGREAAIEFYSIVALANSFSIYSSLFVPNVGNYDPLYAGYSAFPNVFTNQFTYAQVGILSTMILTLGTRTAAIALTHNKNISFAQYMMMINGFAWGAFFGAMISVDTELKNKYTHIPLVMSVIGDLASLGTYFLYQKTYWSAKRTLLVSLSGWVGASVGFMLRETAYGGWMFEHPGLNIMIWSSIGLTTGILLTLTLPKDIVNDNYGFYISPRINAMDKFGMDMNMYVRF